jgi:lipopolysaccharide export system permease protein
MQFVWKYVDDLVGKGLEWIIIGKLLILVSATMVSLALPLAILLSSLMTFGNLGEYMELTAIKASGISLQRAMRSVFIFCVLMSGAAFYFSNNVLPIANLKMRTLLHDIQNKRPELNIKPGIFNSDIQNFVIRIGKKSNDGKLLEQIMIYDHTNHAGNDRLIIAEKGIMKLSTDKRYLELKLVNGKTYTEAEPNKVRRGRYPFLRENFTEDLIRFDLSIFDLSKSDENLFKKNYQMLNLTQLSKEADTLNMQLVKEKSYLIESLFNGPFFKNGEKYTTVFNVAKKVNPKDSIRQDSLANIQKLKIEKRQQMEMILKGKEPFIDSITPIRSGFVTVPTLIGNAPKVELKDKKNVLVNYGKADQIKIFEAADKLLRSNKSTLDYSMENFKQEQERINRHQIEWHRKFTLSFACLLLFLIGAPLGAIVKKGGLGMPVVISLVFFITYHMVSITGEKLARENVTTSFWGMWLSAIILLPIGLFLTYKATTDSKLFESEAYVKLFKRISFSKKNKTSN